MSKPHFLRLQSPNCSMIYPMKLGAGAPHRDTRPASLQTQQERSKNAPETTGISLPVVSTKSDSPSLQPLSAACAYRVLVVFSRDRLILSGEPSSSFLL
jgi:hypothetical protein